MKTKNATPRIRKPFLALLIITLLLLLFSIFQSSRILLQQPKIKKPTTAYEWYRYGKYLDSKQQFQEAEKSLKQALKLDPKLYKALIQLGAMYSDQGDFIKAIPLFEKAAPLAKANKDNANYEIDLYNLGQMYVYENKPEEAWRYLKQAYAMKKELGENSWPNDRLEATYYVMNLNKAKFIQSVKNTYPKFIRKRIDKIHRFAYFFPRKTLAECEEYLTDNPGSRFTPDILSSKVWVLERTRQYDKAVVLLNTLKNYPLRKDQKEWASYSLYWIYYNTRQFDNALTALEDLRKNHPDLYSPVWFKYQKALIYKGKKDYNSEKIILQEIIKSDPGQFCYVGKRCSERRYVLRARERLVEIYSAQGDYLNGFLEMANFYTPYAVIMWIVSWALSFGFLILLFLIYSRLFFYKKIGEVLKSKFRLRHLWLFWILISLLTPFMQLFLFGINYFAHNLLGRLKLDPFVLGILAAEVLTVGLCIRALRDKYKFDRVTLGFVSKGARYNLGIPLLVVAGLLLFGIGYSYFLEKVLYIASPEHPLHDLIEQFKLQGALSQKGLLLTSIAIIGPISEEILFRIFLFLFLSQFTGKRSAVIISALVFAFGHNTFLAVPYYFVIAVTFSILYLKTKSILPSIISHGLLNLLIFFLP